MASPTKPPRAILLRALLFAAILTAGFVVIRWTPVADLLTRENMVAFFQTLRDSWWAPLLLIALFAFTSPLGVPVSGYMLGAGAVFGFAAGALYNMIGLLLGMTTSYYLAKVLGREFVVHVTRGKLRRAELMFERSGFWPLVQIRFLPVPFAVVNFGAALAGIRAPLFLTAGFVGLVPATIVHTYFIARIFEAVGTEHWVTPLAWYVVVLVLLNLLLGFPSIRGACLRRRRYRELKARRRAREAQARDLPGRSSGR